MHHPYNHLSSTLCPNNSTCIPTWKTACENQTDLTPLTNHLDL